MKRTTKAILYIILIPILMVVPLVIICRLNQPTVLTLSNNAEVTNYINEKRIYEIVGHMNYFPGMNINPKADNLDLTSASYFQTLEALKSTCPSYKEISRYGEAADKDALENNFYTGSIIFQMKLPMASTYSLWLPQTFCGLSIYVNGEEIHPMYKIGSTYAFPTSELVNLPQSDDGFYSVVLNIHSPENFYVFVSDAILFGASKQINRAHNTLFKSELIILCTIFFSILFFLVQSLAFKLDKNVTRYNFLLIASALISLTANGGPFLSHLPPFPYLIGLLIQGVSIPFFLILLIQHSRMLFPKYFPKKIGLAIIIIQLLPVIHMFAAQNTLNGIGFFLVGILPFALCLYLFVMSYDTDEPFSLPYGITIIMIESGYLLFHATYSFAIPVHHPSIYGVIALTVVEIAMLASKYSKQAQTEKYYREELERKLAAKQASENAFLNAQMKPHFLYNTLNTIADCCVTDSPRAKSLINSLSDYLRLVLSLDNMEETVPLTRELELADAYTAIEKERFPSIKFYKDYPYRLPLIKMPAITIQPLIENAIKHGVRKIDKPGVITLRIVDEGNNVTFYVSDNGPGMTQETIDKLFLMPKANKSIGIYNIDKRLKNLYGRGLSVESTINLGTCVSFSIPKHLPKK